MKKEKKESDMKNEKGRIIMMKKSMYEEGKQGVSLWSTKKVKKYVE